MGKKIASHPSASHALELQLLLKLIDEAYEKQTWHGPNLKGSFRGVSAEQAAWRPAADRHCIGEVVMHAAYWKYVVRRRILGEKRGSFPLKGSNWFPMEKADAKRWTAAKKLLDEMHRSLKQAIESLPSGQLATQPDGSKMSHLDLISGVAFHDVYHAGQIQLLKRLYASR